MQGARILVVDDDPDVRGLVRELLERAGARVTEAADGREALRLLYDVRPEVIVLDVTMPELDGWQTLERVRDLTEVPVLMLTARDTELEKVRGLRAGADDYVTKPFGRQELLARIGVLLRRAASMPAWGPGRETYADGRVSVDVTRAEVRVADRDVQLTPLEFRLLVTFLRNQGQVLSRDQLLELVWGDTGAVHPSQVKVTVSYLRRKLIEAPDDEDPIETVRGFGYRWRAGS
jgi:DNA-binding response OmpR family regulator